MCYPKADSPLRQLMHFAFQALHFYISLFICCELRKMYVSCLNAVGLMFAECLRLLLTSYYQNYEGHPFFGTQIPM